MKKIFVLLSLAIFTGISCLAQKAEVLYFKADLPCCHARACNNLEANIKTMIESYYADGSVSFKTVRLSDPDNVHLIEKFNARSQTVVIVSMKRGKENITDISDMVRAFARSNNTESFEKDLTAKIDENLR